MSDDELHAALEASNSLYVTGCDGSRMGIMLTYHQLEDLQRLAKNAHKRLFDADLLAQVTHALDMAKSDHDKHVKKGTCARQSTPPINKRTKQWR